MMAEYNAERLASREHVDPIRQRAFGYPMRPWRTQEELDVWELLHELARRNASADAQHAEIERLRGLLETSLRYFNHVKNWSTHGPADIGASALAESIDAAFADDACPCRSGGIGDDGLAKQPCDECDAEDTP